MLKVSGGAAGGMFYAVVVDHIDIVPVTRSRTCVFRWGSHDRFPALEVVVRKYDWGNQARMPMCSAPTGSLVNLSEDTGWVTQQEISHD